MSSDYRAGPVGAGTVSAVALSTTVNGTGTAFTTQFQPGDRIVIISPTDTHITKIVDTVTNDIVLDVTVAYGASYPDRPYYGLRDADGFVTANGLGIEPDVRYQPGGERVVTGAGTEVWRGVPRALWNWASMSVAEWTALKDYLIDGAFSDLCYVETRDDEDGLAVYKTALRFPNPFEMERDGDAYNGVGLNFVLVAET